eukprot:TRINITY_DN36991_c0_g1_i1.p1 TRINITY_DN36991_c0_g1~~TRINITY_DN36991_c0_g1_i1.p1  ORF type:complete len:342 (+),score=43.62 TRINITY_DN36991_c0_g1_i1:89-1114(+)
MNKRPCLWVIASVALLMMYLGGDERAGDVKITKEMEREADELWSLGDVEIAGTTESRLCDSWSRSDVGMTKATRSTIPLVCSRDSSNKKFRSITPEEVSEVLQSPSLSLLYYSVENQTILCSVSPLDLPLLQEGRTVNDMHQILYDSQTQFIILSVHPYSRFSRYHDTTNTTLDQIINTTLSQTQLCHVSLLGYAFIGRIDSCKDRKRVMIMSGINVEQKERYLSDWSNLTKGQLNLISQQHEDDFTNFGYTPHSKNSDYQKWKLLPGRTFSMDPDWDSSIPSNDFASCRYHCLISNTCLSVSWKGGGDPASIGYRSCLTFTKTTSFDGVHNSEFDSAVKL